MKRLSCGREVRERAIIADNRLFIADFGANTVGGLSIWSVSGGEVASFAPISAQMGRASRSAR